MNIQMLELCDKALELAEVLGMTKVPVSTSVLRDLLQEFRETDEKLKSLSPEGEEKSDE